MNIEHSEHKQKKILSVQLSGRAAQSRPISKLEKDTMQKASRNVIRGKPPKLTEKIQANCHSRRKRNISGSPAFIQRNQNKLFPIKSIVRRHNLPIKGRKENATQKRNHNDLKNFRPKYSSLPNCRRPLNKRRRVHNPENQ